MASPTILTLAADVATLTAKVAALEAWKQQVIDLAASREARIADLEAYVSENRALIDELNESDEASGWKAWRESKKAEAPKK